MAYLKKGVIGIEFELVLIHEPLEKIKSTAKDMALLSIDTLNDLKPRVSVSRLRS
jgi:hypothetical protein